ncbi:MAG: signal peptide peptidase SppA [Gemmatales bacterium]|nr:signal peptide peptidase SppA [Gemmatales bacterium]MCS7160866.1 signal peptide peptidase SppA [Gemmatales bacterium]MDW8176068.1 signal peptide peptidase SppA [Gemmatales bacterium]MDW8222473.1 signal peptide peptidase SppA [Gemmatales bacterium]
MLGHLRSIAAYSALIVILMALNISSAQQDKTAAASWRIAVIRLGGNMEETPTAPDPILGIQLENLRTRLDRMQRAARDRQVQALLLHIDELDIGWGRVAELRHAISDFRRSGKPCVAFLESGGLAEYLVASACDEVFMPEAGMLFLSGLRMQMFFYKDLLDKLGVQADMIQMGDFKGAAEPYIRNRMSPALKKHLETVLDDMYSYVVETIAESRKQKNLDVKKVRELLDQGPFTPRQALQQGLIDRLAYESDLARVFSETKKVKAQLVSDYGKPRPREPGLFDIFKMLSPPIEPRLSDRPKIALIYAIGVIMPGKGTASPFGEAVIGADTYVEAIRRAESEPSIKAIVIRVDSPGGSALASDLIWNEVNKCKKPVIVSMGDTAASGGYYISMAAKRIFAEPGTITGSIGVVGGKLVIRGLMDKIGLTTDTIDRGANAGLLSLTEPWNDKQREQVTALMRDTYDQFLDKALAGRKRAGQKWTRQDLEKIAGGRIWTGRQAKTLGLVDELGTLSDAIAYAKKEAGFDPDEDVEIYILPRPKSPIEALLESFLELRTPQPLSSLTQLAQQMPELRPHLRHIAVLWYLRYELVWTYQPMFFRITGK